MAHHRALVAIFVCSILATLSNAQLESFAQQQELEKKNPEDEEQQQQPNERSPITKIFVFKGERREDEQDDSSRLDYGKTFGDIFSKMMMFNHWRTSGGADKPTIDDYSANSNSNTNNYNTDNTNTNNYNTDKDPNQSFDYQSMLKNSFPKINGFKNNKEYSNDYDQQASFEYQPMAKMQFFKPTDNNNENNYDNNRKQDDSYMMKPSSYDKQMPSGNFDYQPYQQPDQSATPSSMMFQPPPFFMRPPLVMPQMFTPPPTYFPSFKSNPMDSYGSSSSDGQFYVEDTDSESPGRFGGEKSKFGSSLSSLSFSSQNDKDNTNSDNNNNNNNKESNNFANSNNNPIYKQKDRLKSKKPIDIVKIVEILPSAEPFGCSCGPMIMKSGWSVGKRCVKRCAAHQHHNEQQKHQEIRSIENVFQG